MSTTPLAIPFVPSVPGFTTGLPGVKDIIGEAISYVANRLLGGNPLQNTLNVLVSSPEPSFSSAWFILLYSEMLGCMMVLIFGGVVWQLLRYSFGAVDLVHLFTIGKRGLQFFVLGGFIPPIVGFTLWISDMLTRTFATAGNIGMDHPSKTKESLALLDLPGNLALKVIAYGMGVALNFEVTPMKQLALFYTLLFVVAAAFATFSAAGGWLFRWVFGGLASIAISVPLMALELSLGGRFMYEYGVASTDKLTYLVIIGSIAAIIPFGVFFAVLKSIKVRQQIARQDEQIRVSTAALGSRGYDEAHVRRQFTSSLVRDDYEGFNSRGSGRRAVGNSAARHGVKIAADKAASLHPAAGASVRAVEIWMRR